MSSHRVRRFFVSGAVVVYRAIQRDRAGRGRNAVFFCRCNTVVHDLTSDIRTTRGTIPTRFFTVNIYHASPMNLMQETEIPRLLAHSYRV